MFTIIEKATENGKNIDELKKSLSITSPLGKKYNYEKAMNLANLQGLLKPDGDLNQKMFKIDRVFKK
jgi:hypothetical protein